MTCGGGADCWTTTVCVAAAARLRRLHRHLDLFVGLEVARGLRLLAKPLHGVHDVVGLREERVADVAHPVGLLAEGDEHLGERDQRRNRRIPRLVLDHLHRLVALGVRMRLRPRRGRGEILRIGRGHQQLRQQRIGIQRDLRRQLVELLVGERLVGGLRERMRRQRQNEHSQEVQQRFHDGRLHDIPRRLVLFSGCCAAGPRRLASARTRLYALILLTATPVSDRDPWTVST